ncbi:MAG TPA: TolC family protein [Nitrospirota bacterium]|nr:TolC family protein [Nitrospirota bacterium]
MKCLHEAAQCFLVLISLWTAGAAGLSHAAEPGANNPEGNAAAEVQSYASTSLQSTPTGTRLGLNQCIEIALKQNPTILASLYGVNASQSRVGEARYAYYPQFSASASYYKIQPLSVQTPTTTIKPDTYEQYSGSVSVSQNLLDFGKTSAQVDISKYNLASARSDLRTTQDTVILSVKQAYYGVLQAKRNRDVAADVIKQFQLHLDQARGFYSVGTKARIDVIKAEVDLSNAKLSLINAENAIKIAWVTLNNVMGVPDAPEYQIEDDLSIHKFPVTLEEATSRAYSNRPDLQSIIAKRQAAETNIGLARTGYYPVLSGNASYNWTADRVSDLDQNHYWNAGVVLTVPLFSGFLTSHQVAEAKANFYAAKANEETLRQQIVLDVRQAYLNLQAADASIATAELASKQAKENLDLANGRYAAGVGSPVEVSDAFATYVTAQANFTQSLSNYKIAQANIEKAMGAR